MWLYMPSAFVPDTPESTLELPLPASSPMSAVELFVTSSGKATPRPLSWPGWKTRTWSRRLSTVTLPPSTADAGADAWISSLRASRASRSVSPVDVLAQRTSDTFGPTCCGSSGSPAPGCSSSKTSQASFQLELFSTEATLSPTLTYWTPPRSARRVLETAGNCKSTGIAYTGDFSKNTASAHCTMSSADWKKSVQQRRGASLARRKSARRMKDCGSSSSQNWPTADAAAMERTNQSMSEGAAVRPTLALAAATWPTARANERHGGKYQRDRGQKGKERPTLTGMADTWNTPMTKDAGKQSAGNRKADNWQTPAADSFRCRGGDRADEQGLDQQARLFPTPASRDFKGANGPDHLENGTGRLHMDQLPNFIEHSFRLPPTTSPDGSNTSEARRVLNPRFVEALMGWPIGWTSCAAVATASFQSWRRTHLSALFAICMRGGRVEG